MKKVDMSEKAVLRRLRQVDQLRDLCLSLMKAKPISEAEAIELRERRRVRKLESASPIDIDRIQNEDD